MNRLGQIAGVLVIAREPIAQLIDLALVPFDNRVERLAMSAETCLNEDEIVVALGRLCSLRPRCVSAVSGHGHLPVPWPHPRPGPIGRAFDAHLSFRPSGDG